MAMDREIAIERAIAILPNNILIVPGSEPSTTVTSTTLELEIRRSGRETPAIVDLRRALEVIPGSWVKLMSNSNSPTQKFLILPAQDLDDCNCNQVDYYEILRMAARPASEEERQDIASSCSTIDEYNKLMGT
jgi:hypothetical protein